jgi:hypothetical protein
VETVQYITEQIMAVDMSCNGHLIGIGWLMRKVTYFQNEVVFYFGSSANVVQNKLKTKLPVSSGCSLTHSLKKLSLS